MRFVDEQGKINRFGIATGSTSDGFAEIIIDGIRSIYTNPDGTTTICHMSEYVPFTDLELYKSVSFTHLPTEYHTSLIQLSHAQHYHITIT